VIPLKQLGSTQSPHTDRKIGTDIAQANGDGYMWPTGNTGHMKGKFYASTPPRSCPWGER
jgi:hypothetical protein